MYGISALSFYKRGHVGRPRTKVCKLLSPELCFLDHLRGATMACGRSLSMGLIWTSWAMTLGAVAVSRHKVQALQDASRCFKHFRSTCWTCPSFLQVRLSSSFFPLKFWPQIHEDCIYVSASCGGLWRWVHHRLVLRECTSIWKHLGHISDWTNTAHILHLYTFPHAVKSLSMFERYSFGLERLPWTVWTGRWGHSPKKWSKNKFLCLKNSVFLVFLREVVSLWVERNGTVQWRSTSNPPPWTPPLPLNATNATNSPFSPTASLRSLASKGEAKETEHGQERVKPVESVLENLRFRSSKIQRLDFASFDQAGHVEMPKPKLCLHGLERTNPQSAWKIWNDTWTCRTTRNRARERSFLFLNKVHMECTANQALTKHPPSWVFVTFVFAVSSFFYLPSTAVLFLSVFVTHFQVFSCAGFKHLCTCWSPLPKFHVFISGDLEIELFGITCELHTQWWTRGQKSIPSTLSHVYRQHSVRTCHMCPHFARICNVCGTEDINTS